MVTGQRVLKNNVRVKVMQQVLTSFVHSATVGFFQVADWLMFNSGYYIFIGNK